MVLARVAEEQADSSCVAHGAQHLGGDEPGSDRGEQAGELREQAGQADGDEVRPVVAVGERAIGATRTGVGRLALLEICHRAA